MTKSELAKRIIENEAKLAVAKAAYAERDALAEQAVAMGFKEHKTADGTVIVMVDNFAEKNVCFRPAAVRRFELKIERKAA